MQVKLTASISRHAHTQPVLLVHLFIFAKKHVCVVIFVLSSNSVTLLILSFFAFRLRPPRDASLSFPIKRTATALQEPPSVFDKSPDVEPSSRRPLAKRDTPSPKRPRKVSATSEEGETGGIKDKSFVERGAFCRWSN